MADLIKMDDRRGLRGAQRAAILMLALGEDHCTRLFIHCLCRPGGSEKANGTAGAVPNRCEKLVYRAPRVIYPEARTRSNQKRKSYTCVASDSDCRASANASRQTLRNELASPSTSGRPSTRSAK